MSARHQVRWSAAAEKDLIAIVEHISAENPAAAVNAFRKIRTKASGLYHFPERGRVAPELKAQGVTSYRELIIPPWRLIYRIAGREVYVLAALDSRRNLEDLLLQRLVNLPL